MEDLCQLLLNKSSVFPEDEVQDVIHSVILTLLSVEKHLIHIQEADLKVRQWESLAVELFSFSAFVIISGCVRNFMLLFDFVS